MENAHQSVEVLLLNLQDGKYIKMGIKERIEMKSLAGINIKCDTIATDDTYIHIYFISDENNKPELFTSEYQLLNESKYQNWGKGVEVRFDRDSAHRPLDPNKDHIHVYCKNKQLFALNRDGTAHDGCHGIYIPQKLANKIKVEFPDFKIPENRLIESLDIADHLLAEEFYYLIDNQ